jgi:predicted nucleic acid-binding protein
MIAATAIEHDLALVTRNVKDFVGLGVTVFNPWEMTEAPYKATPR